MPIQGYILIHTLGFFQRHKIVNAFMEMVSSSVMVFLHFWLEDIKRSIKEANSFSIFDLQKVSPKNLNFFLLSETDLLPFFPWVPGSSNVNMASSGGNYVEPKISIHLILPLPIRY